MIGYLFLPHTKFRQIHEEVQSDFRKINKPDLSRMRNRVKSEGRVNLLFFWNSYEFGLSRLLTRIVRLE